MKALSCLLVLLTLPAVGQSQTPSDRDQIISLLKEFLAGASRNDPAAHERFWADDLIYTGSSGRRIGKADILKGTKPAPPPKPGDARTTYSAEEIRIQIYGDTAILVFRLVGMVEREGLSAINHYLNSGTLLKRGGKWQVVNWQATKEPRPEEQARNEISITLASLDQSLRELSSEKAGLLVDSAFIWTATDGSQSFARDQFLEALRTGRLKLQPIDSSSAVISIYGEAAIVTAKSAAGESRPSSTDGLSTTVKANLITIMFVNNDGFWKVAAMH